MMPVVRAEIIGGDALGRGQEPALCWWLPDGSLNHHSKGAVATFLHRYVAGLRATEPGYRAFEVRPRPGGGISWATARHDGPFGQIDVTWRVDGGSMELDVLVPGGSRATVVRPGADPHDAGPGRHHWTGPAPTG
jgi:alpha-L-rhamnosidase